MIKRLILKNSLSPGDVCAMTAAVKALHECNPGEFLTDYRGTAPELWIGNPYITPLHDGPLVRSLDMHYPAIHKSNSRPKHFIEGYAEFLEQELECPVKLNDLRPDIHVTEEERRWLGQFQELVGIDAPFWILVAGGKYDYTIKWWDPLRFQKVIDHFHGRVCFVRVGQEGHFHPPLRGVVDLMGKTDIRQMVRLMYHSQGVLCPTTFAMHLAAGVPSREHMSPRRPCVVINGGREPQHWEAYPWHQFIHNVGQLNCCSTGACWRSRTVRLEDGSPQDESICLNPVPRPNMTTLPRCMDMITVEDVCRRMEGYFEDGMCRYLTPLEFRKILPHLTK